MATTPLPTRILRQQRWRPILIRRYCSGLGRGMQAHLRDQGDKGAVRGVSYGQLERCPSIDPAKGEEEGPERSKDDLLF